MEMLAGVLYSCGWWGRASRGCGLTDSFWALHSKHSGCRILNKRFSSRMRVYKVVIGVPVAAHISEITQLMMQKKSCFVIMSIGNTNNPSEVLEKESPREFYEIQRCH